MSHTAHSSPEAQPSGFLAGLRSVFTKVLLSLGFTHPSDQTRPQRQQESPAAPRKHWMFPAMPRDYIRRRRVTRRLSNLIVIPLLSLVAAYVITRQPTGGFSLPRGGRTPAQAAAMVGPGVGASSSVAMAADAAIASLSKKVAPDGYRLADGPYAVTEVPDVVLHDAERSKDLHVRIFYPNDAGPFPVIVFSHGAGGSQSCCDSLTRHWATYGYVTLQPTHDDSVAQRRGSGEEDVRFISGVRDALNAPALWKSRPEDVSFVLDSLQGLQARIPALGGKLDTAHIGVGGHSMGAFTADAIAGALVDLPNRPGTSFVDPRVRAVVLLSPQGPGEFGLTDQSWRHVAVPLLSMTGSLDKAANGLGPDWKKVPFDRSQPGDKYHLFIDGANHMSFVSGRTLSPARAAEGEMILGYANSAALAFWDAYLKSDSGAKNYLNSDALPQFSAGAVKIYRR